MGGKDDDIRDLNQCYLSNQGAFNVVESNSDICGCVRIRRISSDTAELKGLYVRHDRQGHGLGRALIVATINDARRLGHRFGRLDTTRKSPAAIHLFKGFRFKEIERYNDDPFAEIFMELDLNADKAERGA